MVILNWLFQPLHLSQSWVLYFKDPVFYCNMNVAECNMFASIVLWS